MGLLVATGCTGLLSPADTYCLVNSGSCPEIAPDAAPVGELDGSPADAPDAVPADSPDGSPADAPDASPGDSSDGGSLADASDIAPDGASDGHGADGPQPSKDPQNGPPPDASANPWWCVANGTAVTTVPPPPTPSPRPTKVRYRVPIIDFYSAVAGSTQPLTNLTITACGLGDPACSISPKTPTVVPPTSATPLYQIDFDYGFNGFIRITAPDYIATEYYFGGPLLGSPGGTVDPVDGVPVVQGLFIAPITVEAAEAFYMAHGFTIEPGKGLLGPRLLDCNGARADDVTLQVADPTGNGYTLIQNLPVFHDPPIKTDSRAVSGYVNMTPFNYSVSAIAPGGVPYGSTVAVVRPDTLTVFEIRTDNAGVLGR